MEKIKVVREIVIESVEQALDDVNKKLGTSFQLDASSIILEDMSKKTKQEKIVSAVKKKILADARKSGFDTSNIEFI